MTISSANEGKNRNFGKKSNPPEETRQISRQDDPCPGYGISVHYLENAYISEAWKIHRKSGNLNGNIKAALQIFTYIYILTNWSFSGNIIHNIDDITFCFPGKIANFPEIRAIMK